MILADTSIWIDHLRKTSSQLLALLGARELLMHPFVTGELALGSLQDRGNLLTELDLLPQMTVTANKKVILFVSKHRLYGTGINYVDAHLLVAACGAKNVRLWTRDKRLLAASTRLGVAANMQN